MVDTSSKDLAERTRLTNRSDQIREADLHSRWMPPSKDSARRSETELASTLWSRLPIARIADETGFRTIEQVIRAASSSHSAIVGWHAETV